ncbi:SurA N-terminal domain-containing protein [Devosia rhodophyticola]|uniref:SurA N-terminal domain-containing protein n=1 Tax=Devosia rhodophyticola TaxID=3026423 RepID=A0ABY7YXE9_9HYPH|nr:peptidylprolyl isomerase [Devosia rhodophyticola]WDR05847.1 SurA N-terminal domain-containing protein [Devosia rhodophyticola]
MLDSLRIFAKSWPGKIMGGFLLVGLAGFGINNVITSLGSNTVARVGDVEITSRDFLRDYQNQLNRVASQIGRMPTSEEAVSLGVPSMVIGDLAQNAALDQMASNYGLGVSDDRLSNLLRKDPNFAGTLGNFDPTTFSDVLRRSGITESEYLENEAKSAQRQQLVLSLFGDTQLPEAASKLINRFIGDKRTIDYIVLNETDIETPPAPTEDELAAYLKDHQSEYRTVETRSVKVMALSPEIMAQSKSIDDAAIAAEYEKTKASLIKPETRTIEQVVLGDDLVKTFEDGKLAGESFDDLVAANNLSPTELGTLSQAQINDGDLGDAAFSLPADGFAVIDGVAGKRAIHVSAIDVGGQTSLDDAKSDIAAKLALAEAKNDYATILDQIEELRAAFRPIDEIAQRYDLKTYDLVVSADGSALAAVDGLKDADRGKVSQAIFSAEDGKLSPTVTLGANNNVWFDLGTIEPARDETLDEVREEVSTAWTAEKVDAAISDTADKIVARLDAGEALGDIAASMNTFPQLSLQFGRSGEADTSIDSAVASKVFAGGPDNHGTALNNDGEQIVFSVASVVPADGPLEAQALDSINTDQRNGLYAEFVTGVRDEAGLRINEQALQQTLSLVGQ